MDEVHIRCVLEGDINSFRHIVTKYKNMSFSISMSIVKSELLAEEAVQDAFVRAYQNLQSFQGKSAFSTWLYRIVVNESLRKIKRKQLEFVEIDNRTEDYLYASDDSFNFLRQAERVEIINQILLEMPATESLILRLYYLDENTVDSVCAITQLTPSNVKVTLLRARRRFYAYLEKSLKHEMRTIL